MTSRAESLITTTRNTGICRLVRSTTIVSLLLAFLLLPVARAEARQDTLALAMRGFRLPSVRVPRVPEAEWPRFRGEDWNSGEQSRLPIRVVGPGASGFGRGDAGKDDMKWILPLLLVLAVAAAWAFKPIGPSPAESDRECVGFAAKRTPTRSPPSSSGWVSPTIRRPEDK